MPRRSYDQYCALSRALDVLGERWTLLIVRELLAGPRRYTELHADLPGVSTDILAARLKELEADGLVARERLARPANASVYRLTEHGHALLPALAGLAAWGAPLLAERRATDAVRAHWYALPLLDRLLPAVTAAGASAAGVLDVVLDEGAFHLRLAPPPQAPAYGDGPAPHADARLETDAATCRALAEGTLPLPDALATRRARLTGESPLAAALRAAPNPAAAATVGP